MKKTKFEKFLYNRGLLEAFKYNFEHHSIRIYESSFQYFVETTHPSGLIQGAFSWSSTKESWFFWGDVDAEWQSCIKSNKL